MGGGDGTEATPYLIEDFADFQVFSNPNNSATYWAEGVHTRLECDLDLDPNTTGLPIYVAAVIGNFSGAFEGNRHVISNLTIETLSDANGTNDDSNDLGLFGCKIRIHTHLLPALKVHACRVKDGGHHNCAFKV